MTLVSQMENIKMKEDLANLSPQRDENILELVSHLNSKGYVLDEEVKTGTILLKQWNEKYTKELRNFGYKGGKIIPTGHYYPNHGQVYVLIDIDKIEFSETKAICDRWVLQNN